VIYRVELTAEAYVMADSPEAAAKYARRKWRDEIDGLTLDVAFTTEVKSADDVPCDWNEALPFAGEGMNRDERTIRQILEASND
jgi:hypothetical protein